MPNFLPLLRFILVIVLLIAMPTYSHATEWLIDVTKFGAVGDGDQKKALQNTEAIKKAWNRAAKEDGTGGTLYFPPGNYVVNRIGAIRDGFAPLKYTNIKGAGQVKTILTLASGQNSQLLRIPDLFFNASISDMTFQGNAGRNPGTDALVFVRGYNISIHDIWIEQSGGDGLNIGNQQQTRIEQIDVKHSKGWGIVSEDNMSTTFDSICSEYNGKGGLLIKSSAAKGKRSFGPAIIVSGAYFEGEPIGLELQGVSGVEINAVSAHSVPAGVRIVGDSTSGLASTGNIIFAQGSTGDIEIEAGNYGNSIIVGPYTKYMLKIKDRDGRNYIGPLAKAPTEIASVDTSEMDSELTRKDMTNWQARNGENSHWKAVQKKDQGTNSSAGCTQRSSYYELSTVGDEQSSISYTMEKTLAPQTEHYVETALSIYGSCRVELEIYDKLNREYYNWIKGAWTSAEDRPSAMLPNKIPVLTNGTFQTHQFAIKADGRPRQPRLTYFVDGCFGRKARFYCTDIRSDK